MLRDALRITECEFIVQLVSSEVHMYHCETLWTSYKRDAVGFIQMTIKLKTIQSYGMQLNSAHMSDEFYCSWYLVKYI